MSQSHSGSRSEVNRVGQAQPPGPASNPAMPMAGTFYPAGATVSPAKSSSVAVMIAAFFVVFAAGIGLGALGMWMLNQGSRSVAHTTERPAARTATTTGTASADSEFNVLMQKRASATADEYPELANAFEEAENKYPSDYRFPYERAKLNISGLHHHHAFGLLYTAAQRAIDTGKTDQLLSQLEKDRNAEFYQCSRGHSEWQVLENALKTKDKSSLDVKVGGMHDMDM